MVTDILRPYSNFTTASLFFMKALPPGWGLFSTIGEYYELVYLKIDIKSIGYIPRFYAKSGTYLVIDKELIQILW